MLVPAVRQLPRALAVGFLLSLLYVPSASALRFRNADGIRVLSAKRLDPRLVALSVKSAALPGPANVRVLLPSGYGSHPRRRYPVLYLLHGTSGGASDWTVQGDAEKTTARLPLIVVMPDIALNRDGGGWCTNWPDGAYRWETFHIDQLLPWVDRNLRTVRTRAGRAIAGLSQGGFCSMSYAARHPDLFSTALSYSGAPDIYYDSDARAGAIAIINATEVGLDHVPPDSMFGNPVSDGINWAAHDPATLAENLRHTRMYLYWGNGLPGPFDSGLSIGGDAIEMAVWRDNNDFEARVHALGLRAYFDYYGNGTHSWPYWARDLRWSIGRVIADFARPAPVPVVTYTSADDQYEVFGWKVVMHRTTREFSTLEHATTHGFSLAGSGSATVLTPAFYRRGMRYKVTVNGRHVRKSIVLTALRDRRLRIAVPLGPTNPHQQSATQSLRAAVYTTRITIARLGK